MNKKIILALVFFIIFWILGLFSFYLYYLNTNKEIITKIVEKPVIQTKNYCDEDEKLEKDFLFTNDPKYIGDYINISKYKIIQIIKKYNQKDNNTNQKRFNDILIVKVLYDNYKLSSEDLSDIIGFDISPYITYLENYTYDEISSFEYGITSFLPGTEGVEKTKGYIDKKDLEFFENGLNIDPSIIEVYNFVYGYNDIYKTINTEENKKYYLEILSNLLEKVEVSENSKAKIKEFINSKN